MGSAPLEFWIAVAAGFGLIVGSFLNVVLHRLPREESLVRPGSHCPHCGRPVRARDNIPLLSFLLLRGRCRDCGQPISWRYPVVEALCGALWAGSVLSFGPSLEAARAALLSSLLVVLAGLDWDHFWLPDRITLPGAALGLAFQLLLPEGSWLLGLKGALLGAGLLLVASGLFELVRGIEGLGLGDVKMLAMIGAFLGPLGVLVALGVGTLAGAVVGIAGLLRGTSSLATELPFGVFLSLGGLVALFLGETLASAYLGLLR